jgi:hypothetical protein
MDEKDNSVRRARSHPEPRPPPAAPSPADGAPLRQVARFPEFIPAVMEALDAGATPRHREVPSPAAPAASPASLHVTLPEAAPAAAPRAPRAPAAA